MQKIAIYFLFLFSTVMAHCQLPCGIYDDAMRIRMIEEHVLTITKTMNFIKDNQGDENQSFQIVRWTMSKEEHAQEIQNIISEYFLTQRIKINDKDSLYLQKLQLLHVILLDAMKCKQTIDTSHANNLLANLNTFVNLYFDEHGKSHLNDLKNK